MKNFKIEKDIPCPSPKEQKANRVHKKSETKYSFLETIESGSSFECTWGEAQGIITKCRSHKSRDIIGVQRWIDKKSYSDHTLHSRKKAKVRVWIYERELVPEWLRERLDREGK